MPQVLEVVVTVPMRLDSARHDILSRDLRSDTILVDIAPSAFDAYIDYPDTVQYGTTCNQYSILITVPL
jgi:hypothetical protein